MPIAAPSSPSARPSTPADRAAHVNEVVLFIPNAHCPSCSTHILSQLDTLPLPLLAPSVSFLSKQLAFGLPADADVGAATRRVVACLEDAGFEVVQPSEVVDEDPNGGSASSGVGPEQGLLCRLGWWDVGGRRRAKRQEQQAEDRRRQHLANCLECQKQGSAAAAEAHGQAAGADAGEAFELAVSRPRTARLVETTLSIEGMFCAACTKTLTDALAAHPAVTRADVLLLANSAKVTHDAGGVTADALRELVEDTGYGAEVVDSHALDEEAPGHEEAAGGGVVRSTWEVRGMTCAACSGSITKALAALPGVRSSAVSPLQGSAVVDHLATLAPAAVQEAIEDAGFNAALVSAVALDTAAAVRSSTREVRVKLDGMFCHSCVAKVNAHLGALERAGLIASSSAVSLAVPLTSVRYVPSPTFTVRDLLAGLAALDPAFTAAPYAPPSISARARAIQAREAKVLVGHFALAGLSAVPTFVIAIFGMVLLPKGHAFRRYWEEPVWGGAGRGTVALWVLATVVQFGVGRIFYKRAFRPVLAHLRRKPSANRARRWSWRALFAFGSMDLLVAMSTTTAYVASLGMLAVDVRTPRMAMDEEKTMTLFDSCVFLIFFILIGRTLESWAKSKTGDAIALLGTLRPDTALLLSPAPEDADDSIGGSSLRQTVTSSSANTLLPKALDGSLAPEPQQALGSFTTTEIPVSHLELADLILVRPGALPPSDGTVVRGQTSFDESSLTGESRPVAKRAGDEVLTGTVNIGREAVVVRVDRLGEDTMIERVGRAVEGAMSGKSKVEELAERVTGVFVPCVVYFALAILSIWLGLAVTGSIPDDWIQAHGTPTMGDRVFFSFEFYIAVLVVACPCGIGLAAPTAAAVGLGLAAKAGVLAQGGGSAFQAAVDVDTIVFDKTGTITTGKPTVTDYDYLPCLALQPLGRPHDLKSADDRRFILSTLRDLELQSSHPLASALHGFADDQLALLPAPAPGTTTVTGASEEIVGRGLKAVVTASSPGQPPIRFEVCVGNEALMASVGAALPPSALLQNWKEGAKSVVLCAVKRLTPGGSGYEVCASFAVADPPRPEAKETIEKLLKACKDVWLCSGDNEVTARAVARQVGIPESCVVAGVLPEGKAAHINLLKGLPAFAPGAKGMRFVLFAGDGLNDSVALAAADVGVAMGSGSQVSVVSADFVLLNSSLDSLHALLHISRRVLNRTKLNFCWALVFNVVCLPLAAGVFYAAGRTKLAPVWSALAMALSSVSVVTSSLALRWGL